MKFAIQNKDGDFWLTDFGWVPDQMDIYSEDEKAIVNLPTGGEWVEVKFIK